MNSALKYILKNKTNYLENERIFDLRIHMNYRCVNKDFS